MDGVEAGCSATGWGWLINRSCHAILTLLHWLYVRVERGLSENFQAHLREFVQPALGQWWPSLKRQIKAIKQRVIDVKDRPLADFIDGIVDLLDYLRFLVGRDILVLNFAQKRDNLLCGRLQQPCIIHRSDLESGSLDQFFVEKFTKIGERQLVIVSVDRPDKHDLELFRFDLEGLEDLAVVRLGDFPVLRVALKHSLLEKDLHPSLVDLWLTCWYRLLACLHILSFNHLYYYNSQFCYFL